MSSKLLTKVKSLQRSIEDQEIQKTLSILENQLLEYLNDKRINNNLQSLYIIQINDFIEVGVTSNPSKILKQTKDVINIYVTHLINNTKQIKDYLYQTYKENINDDKIENQSFGNIIKTLEDKFGCLQNKNFKTNDHIRKDYSKRIYGSDGKVYKSVATFAKAFDLNKQSVADAINSGLPVKGITLTLNKIENKKKCFEPKTRRRKCLISKNNKENN